MDSRRTRIHDLAPQGSNSCRRIQRQASPRVCPWPSVSFGGRPRCLSNDNRESRRFVPLSYCQSSFLQREQANSRLSMDAFLMGNGYSSALDNDHMYELAQDTARYRERGVGHHDQLAKITEMLEDFSVELEVLRSVRVSDREMRKKLNAFYKTQVTIGRSVRRFPANILLKL